MPQLPRIDAVLVQAVIAGALSFAHLHDLAAAAGQDGWKAWAYPVSVDLLLVAAWHRLRNGTAKTAAWCWFLIALAASLGANIATAGLLDLNQPPDWLRILVAGWPALAFFGGTLLAHQATDNQSEYAPQAAEAPSDEFKVTATPEATPASATEPALPAAELPAELEEETPQPSELVTSPAEEIVPDPVPEASPPVPQALISHAQKIATDYKNRTGFPIDAETLRARLGVPAPMAAAIQAQLT